MKALNVIEGTGTVSRYEELEGTILDSGFLGKEIRIDLKPLAPIGYPAWYEGDHYITEIVLPDSIRRTATRNDNGDIQLTPMLVTINVIIDAQVKSDANAQRAAFDRFLAAHKAACAKQLQAYIGRVRVPRSGALVALPYIHKDACRAHRFSRGDISNLDPASVGFSSRVMNRMNNGAKGEHAILSDGQNILVSRWPTTDAISMKVTEIKDRKDAFVIFVSPDVFSHPDIKGGDDIFAMDLVEGDNDGDTLNFNVCMTPEAKSELAWKNATFAAQITKRNNCPPVSLNWKMQEAPEVETIEKERSILKDGCEQKVYIAAISLMLYAGCSVIGEKGDEIGITLHEWIDTMTEALEKCFDKKHNNASNPRVLLGTLMNKRGFEFYRPGVQRQLVAQGINLDVIRRMTDWLKDNGKNLRKVAAENLSFAILHGDATRPPIYQFLANIPNGETAAKYFKDRLFPAFK